MINHKYALEVSQKYSNSCTFVVWFVSRSALYVLSFFETFIADEFMSSKNPPKTFVLPYDDVRCACRSGIYSGTKINKKIIRNERHSVSANFQHVVCALSEREVPFLIISTSILHLRTKFVPFLRGYFRPTTKLYQSMDIKLPCKT